MARDHQSFSMPMFNTWVPERIRPWIFLLCAFLFQLSGGVYFSLNGHMMGSTSMMREDLQLIAMFGVVGVNMPFPFIFRFKMRFTNRQLMINAAAVIIACNILCMYVTSLPLLCAISYIAGFFKLCGTFECFSNIRLWISPRQDFGVFLPGIYIIILMAAPASNWTALWLTQTLGSWQAMHWFMCVLMLIVILTVYSLTHNFRMFPHVPLISLDILGCLLWSAMMLEIIWLFTYGEYYNWWDSRLWRGVLLSLPVTIAICLLRSRRIRHPYISFDIWKHWRLLPILGMFFVAEMMNATPHVLQNVLTGGVLHFGWTTTKELYLMEMVGYVAGCAFTIFWHRPLNQKYTRLLSVGFAALLLHHVIMYFQVTQGLPIERLYLPTFLRTFGYAIFFSTMTLYLKDLIEFPTFLMALTVSGFIRNGVCESMCSGVYGYGFRYKLTEALSRGIQTDIVQTLMTATKEMYGIVCLIGVFILLLMLLYDVQPIRRAMFHMPSNLALLRRFRKTIE
ncbi:MAG: hypothetical protein IJR71_09485 [Prevotella sp.]|nr:hypothetical protein [Prevotella sp.]